MPTTPTYPGVYIEEIPSGVRTITGVSTSVTAFVGYTKNGPINKAEEVLSFADFERKFGGLAKDSLLSYAVQHFFMNGGQQAYVVRLAQAGTAMEAALTLGRFDSAAEPSLLVRAREPGARANGMAITVDYDTAHPDSTFNLRLEDSGTGRAEEFFGVTMNSKSRRNVDSVVNGTSQLVQVKTNEDALADVEPNKGQSRSGRGIIHTTVDADHRQFVITLDEEDGPKLVTIYDGLGQRPSNLQNLGEKIRDAVKASGSGEAYQSFDFQVDATNGILTLISGEEGDGSFVRVTSAGTLDAARVLKLGVANGGREVDAAAEIRPAPNGTTSGSLTPLPAFTSNLKLLVTIDGDGPHEVSVFRRGTDTPPADLNALRLLLREKLRQVKPKQAGSMAFMGIDSEVVGDKIQVLSGAEDNNSLVEFGNLRVLESLTSVFFKNANDGLAVGEGGTILKTTNGGQAWTVQNPPAAAQNVNLRGVFFRTASDTAWAVGEGGVILTTADNGQTWTVQNLPAAAQNANLHGVYFKNNTDGLVVGDSGTILKTTNGGQAWTVQNPPAAAQNANLRGVFFRTASDTAWAVGEGGVILTTADNGQTWTVQNPPQNQPAVTTANLQGVHFLDINNGLAVGEGGTILKTTDGGQAWTVQNPPAAAQNVNLRGVFFRSNTLGWAVGDNGTILKTTDGGQAWTTQDSDVTDHLYGVHFFNDDSGWAAGEGGTILFTDDGGGDWEVQQAVADTSAADLQLTAPGASHNVKVYTLGVGKALGAQSGATPGQDGLPPRAADFQGSEERKSGIHALLDVDLFNILCLPGVTDFDELNDAIAVLSTAVPFCERLRALCIIDCPKSWTTFDDALDGLADFNSVRSKNAAMYFPRVEMPDPLDDNRLRTFPPCGIVAGIYARTDATRGVWKAPAGQEASLTGVPEPGVQADRPGERSAQPARPQLSARLPHSGAVVWGARTLRGADRPGLGVEVHPDSAAGPLPRGEPLPRHAVGCLRTQRRAALGADPPERRSLHAQPLPPGRLPGYRRRSEAYFVKCDKETTTQNDINLGIVNILVGFAPLKPAEFVIIKIQQMAGQIQT